MVRLMEVGKNTFTPFVVGLEKKEIKVRGFLVSLEKDLKDNVDESFNRQVYHVYPTEISWSDLQPATVHKREKLGTWYGMNGSILKEKYNLWRDCKINTQIGKRSGNNYVRLWTKDPKAIEHQTGRESPNHMEARPVYSLSKETIDRVTQKVFNYFTVG
jgi:phage gpG-like protein